MRYNYLSKDGFELAFSKLISSRDKAIALLFYELGLKASELVNLNVSQVSSQKIVIQSRELVVSHRLSKILLEYIFATNPTKFLFFTRQSPQMTVRRIEQILKYHKLVSPTKLRRSSVINALDKKTVQEVRADYDLKSLREKQYLDRTQYKTLQTESNSKRDSLLFTLFYEAGLTISQVVSLRISNFKKDSVTIPRDDQRLTIHPEKIILSKSLSKQIQKYIKSQSFVADSYLFTSRQSSQISARRIQQIFKSYSKILGVEITPQILANSAKLNSIESITSYSQNHSLVSQTSAVRIPRFYEGYIPKKHDRGGNEIT